MDCSLQGFSVRGILQARILELGTIPFASGSFQPRDQTQVSSLEKHTNWEKYVPTSAGFEFASPVSQCRPPFALLETSLQLILNDKLQCLLWARLLGWVLRVSLFCGITHVCSGTAQSHLWVRNFPASEAISDSPCHPPHNLTQLSKADVWEKKISLTNYPRQMLAIIASEAES